MSSSAAQSLTPSSPTPLSMESSWGSLFSFSMNWDVSVYLYEAASTFRGLSKAGDKSQYVQHVMLVTTVNPKLFGGTRFFFDTNLPEITESVSRVGGALSQVFPCVDTLEGIKKKELFSIADLNTSISNSDEQTEEADFLCKARTVGVVRQMSGPLWHALAATQMCNRLPNQCCQAAIGGEENLPSCLEELTEKEFVFWIRRGLLRNLHCHPDELNSACSKCFHFFLGSEFIEMIMGLNTISHR